MFIFEVFMAMNIHVGVIWVVTPCKFYVRIPTFRRTTLPPSSGWRPRLEFSPLWKAQVL